MRLSSVGGIELVVISRSLLGAGYMEPSLGLGGGSAQSVGEMKDELMPRMNGIMNDVAGALRTYAHKLDEMNKQLGRITMEGAKEQDLLSAKADDDKEDEGEPLSDEDGHPAPGDDDDSGPGDDDGSGPSRRRTIVRRRTGRILDRDG